MSCHQNLTIHRTVEKHSTDLLIQNDTYEAHYISISLYALVSENANE